MPEPRDPEDCPLCWGEGRVRVPAGWNGNAWETCRNCHGSGSHIYRQEHGA